MKKLLVFLLILAVAGGLFAQEITFSGDVKTGVRIQAESGDNAADPGLDLWHDDAAGPQLSFYGTYNAGNYGLKLGIVGDASASPLFDVDNAFVWFKPLDLLKISAGKGFGDIPNVYDWATGGGPGVQFLVTPIEGLTIGLTLGTPGNNKGIVTGGTANGYARYKPEYVLMETAFGVKYESSLFKAHAAFKLDSEADTNDPLSSDAFGLGAYLSSLPGSPSLSLSATKPEKEMFASAAVEVTAVPNLTIDAAGKIENLNDWADDGAARAEIHEKAAYQINDPFNVYLTVKEVLFSNENAFTGLHGEAGVGYKLNSTFKLNFALGADNWIVPDTTIYKAAEWNGFHNDTVWFKPSVDITVGEKAAITCYYKGTVQSNSLKNVPDRPFKSLVQFNFVWSY
jgi:hypothetical protein